MKSTLTFFLLLSLTIISGCGGQPVPAITLTAQQVFAPKVGDVWTFRNGYGDTTTITVEAAPDDAAGTVGHHITLHFTKDADRAYWGLNIPQAEDHFLMLQLPDGSWRGVADIPSFPQSCPWCAGHTAATLNWHTVDGQPTPYMIVPASVQLGQTVNFPTHYHWFQQWDVNTTADISSPATDMGDATWQSTFTIEMVDTPAYSGLAIVSHQFEGTCGNQWCNEEKWYFAPGVGLVEIQPVGQVPVPADPLVTIKRVH